MRNTILGTIVGVVIGVAAAWLLLKHPGEKEAEHHEEKKEESRIQHGTNGEVFLKLDKETQERCGLKVVALEAVEAPLQTKAFGRVLDPSILATQLVDITSAKAALEASSKVFERLKLLHSQGQNASTAALEAAEATMKRDKILVEAAESKLRLAWGKTLAERKDLPEFVNALIDLRAALVRLDLPIGEVAANLPLSARVAPVNAEQNLIEARFLGLATSADPQVQGQGFVFAVETSSLLPGAAILGYLSMPGTAQKGVLVARSALVRYEGEVFVYLQKGEDKFEREEVKLDVPIKEGWLVTGELSAGEKIVVTGAQQLLSEELKARTAEE